MLILYEVVLIWVQVQSYWEDGIPGIVMLTIVLIWEMGMLTALLKVRIP